MYLLLKMLLKEIKFEYEEPDVFSVNDNGGITIDIKIHPIRRFFYYVNENEYVEKVNNFASSQTFRLLLEKCALKNFHDKSFLARSVLVNGNTVDGFIFINEITKRKLINFKRYVKFNSNYKILMKELKKLKGFKSFKVKRR